MPEDPTSSPPIPRKMTLARWLFNPFLRIAGGHALAIGLLAIVATGLVAPAAGVHFPGLLGLRPAGSVQVWVPLVQVFVHWFAITGLFGVVSLLVAPKTVRLVDVAGTLALARWPLLPATAVLAVPSVQRTTRELAAAAAEGELVAPGWGFLVAGLVTATCAVWTVQLMWKAFSVSCNKRGGRAVALFIGAIVIGEALTTFLAGQIARIGS